MGHKKKSRDPIVNLIRSFWTRKRAERKFTVPTDYLLGVADQLWRVNPSKEIVFNTIKDVWINGAERGYDYKGDAVKFFKDKQNQDFDKDFNDLKDQIDDLVHEKSNQPK